MSFVSAGKDKSLRQHRGSRSTMGVVGTLVLVLALLAEQTQQQVQKLQLEEHVSVKAPESSRRAGVAHAAGNFAQVIIHNELIPSLDGSNLLLTLPFGEDKVPLKIAIDTGSQALWIKKEECGNGTLPGSLALDCQNAKKPSQLGYLDGGLTGRLGYTTVWFGGGKIASRHHQFTVAEKIDPILKYQLMGLSGSFDGGPTLLSQLKEQKIIADESFSIYQYPNKTLNLILGGIDESLVKPGSIRVTTPIKDKVAYYIDVDKVTFGSETIITATTQSLMDSGNSLLSFPRAAKNKVFSQLQKYGLSCFLRNENNPQFDQVFCDFSEPFTTENGPEIVYYIGGQPFSLTFDSLVMKDDRFCRQVVPAFGSDDISHPTRCPVRLEFTNSMSNQLILGKAFIEQKYLTFNRGANLITFIEDPKV